MSKAIVWFVALDWVIFGVMHFTAHERALQEMPDYIPQGWRDSLLYLSGALEIIAGAMILIPGGARKAGAILSVLILVGLAPAIVHITLSDRAFVGWPPLDVGFRLLMIPHALLMAYFSIRIWRG